jgi:hypothetical protein
LPGLIPPWGLLSDGTGSPSSSNILASNGTGSRSC